MKQRLFFLLFGAMTTLIVGGALPTFFIFPSTHRQYQRLMQEASTPAGESTLPIEKERVQKVLLTRSERKKTRLQIEADHSYFLIERDSGGSKYYERFFRLEGAVEEKEGGSLFKRHFSSSKAMIDYSLNRFEAFDTHIVQGNQQEVGGGDGSLRFSHVDGNADELVLSFPKRGELECCLREFEGMVVLPGHTPLSVYVPRLFTTSTTVEGFAEEKKIVFGLGEEDQFFCGKGVWNLSEARGSFYASEDGSPVRFFHTPVDRGDQAVSFSLLSNELVVHLANEKAEQAPVDFLRGVETIRTLGHVQIEYDENISVDADEGLYRNGILTLWADPKKKTCLVYDLSGNTLETNQIEVDFLSSLLALSKPEGSLFSEEDESIRVRADHLVWDPYSHRFTLMGRIFLDHSSWGSEETIGEVVVLAKTVDGSTKIQAFEAKGKSVFTFRKDLMPSAQRLTCSGDLVVDEAKGVISLSSGSFFGQEGNREMQGVVFEDRWGRMLADKMKIEYHTSENRRVFDAVHLEGHVALMNQFLDNPNEDIPFRQYALADEVFFYPQTKELILEAADPRRVLFFDQGNHIQISASAIKARRDALTKKDSFQGIGNVRFSLQEKELAMLKNQFPYFADR